MNLDQIYKKVVKILLFIQFKKMIKLKVKIKKKVLVIIMEQLDIILNLMEKKKSIKIILYLHRLLNKLGIYFAKKY